MADKILCVDDDPSILAAYRMLQSQQRPAGEAFHIDTATSGEEGLEALRRGASYAVIISDMEMPGMDGVQFLCRAQDVAPDSVRMMLTGYTDIEVAMNAVNEGHIFRFLTKPCSSAKLSQALTAGLRQYRLHMAEKELLEKTLAGSIKLLTDVLSLVSPAAFGRAQRVQHLVQRLAKALGVTDLWQLDLAALLSQTGCVTLPENILGKVYVGGSLTPEEWALYKDHPKVGHDLIADIPRLEEVAAIVAYQEKCFDGSGVPADGKRATDIPFGARLLKVALDFERFEFQGFRGGKALTQMQQYRGRYDPAVLDALRRLVESDACLEMKELFLKDLLAPLDGMALADGSPGASKVVIDQSTPMVLSEDVRSISGVLILSKGQKITVPLLQRLRNLARNSVIHEPIRVWMPSRGT